MKLLIKIPTKWRGLEWLDKWLECTNENTTFLISVDSDEYSEAQMPKLKRVIFEVGESENKIHAINRDVSKHIEKFDVLAVFGDDFEPTQNFDTRILECFEYYQNHTFGNTDFCLHFSDGYTNERLCTYPIMGREYWNRFGYVYSPAYRSVFADNEQMEVAQLLKRYIYIGEAICRHRHYVNDKLVQKDELYRINEAKEKGDRETYMERKKKNFSIAPDWRVVNIEL